MRGNNSIVSFAGKKCSGKKKHFVTKTFAPFTIILMRRSGEWEGHCLLQIQRFLSISFGPLFMDLPLICTFFLSPCISYLSSFRLISSPLYLSSRIHLSIWDECHQQWAVRTRWQQRNGHCECGGECGQRYEGPIWRSRALHRWPKRDWGLEPSGCTSWWRIRLGLCRMRISDQWAYLGSQ